jgi:hypothetical protein
MSMTHGMAASGAAKREARHAGAQINQIAKIRSSFRTIGHSDATARSSYVYFGDRFLRSGVVGMNN